MLLLQGPVGPFFRRLQEFLEENGLDCRRVSFHAGDRFFSNRTGRIDFSGGAEEWRDRFRDLLNVLAPDRIVLFGAERPAHVVARRLAARAGIPVLCLEEGYIRPGFVTAEWEGNNSASPLAGRLPPADFEPGDAPAPAASDRHSFSTMCTHGAVYYLLRTLLSGSRETTLFHRRFSLVREIFFWTRNYRRRFARGARNFAIIESLLEYHEGRYFLVPLQVAADSQLRRAAHGWNGARLICEVLKSFARHAPPASRLVFKIHPMERGHSNDRPLILRTAEALSVGSRVDVIDTGSIGLLTRHAAGMITINSTSGLSAIHHGVPLLVIGDALYAHEELAICARGRPDFDAFWTCGHVAPEAVRRRYLAWIRQACLKPGDFYGGEAMDLACRGVLERLREPRDVTYSDDEARLAC